MKREKCRDCLRRRGDCPAGWHDLLVDGAGRVRRCRWHVPDWPAGLAAAGGMLALGVAPAEGPEWYWYAGIVLLLWGAALGWQLAGTRLWERLGRMDRMKLWTTARERPTEPEEETMRFLCDGCGSGLRSGQLVRCEALYGDVVGCESCSEWRETEELPGLPRLCTNCGQPVWDSGRVLLGVNDVVLACGACAQNEFAADACEPFVEEELWDWG